MQGAVKPDVMHAALNKQYLGSMNRGLADLRSNKIRVLTKCALRRGSSSSTSVENTCITSAYRMGRVRGVPNTRVDDGADDEQ